MTALHQLDLPIAATHSSPSEVMTCDCLRQSSIRRKPSSNESILSKRGLATGRLKRSQGAVNIRERFRHLKLFYLTLVRISRGLDTYIHTYMPGSPTVRIVLNLNGLPLILRQLLVSIVGSKSLPYVYSINDHVRVVALNFGEKTLTPTNTNYVTHSFAAVYTATCIV